jgi:hypothetical protein
MAVAQIGPPRYETHLLELVVETCHLHPRVSLRRIAGGSRFQSGRTPTAAFEADARGIDLRTIAFPTRTRWGREAGTATCISPYVHRLNRIW